jgi:hypothetical protein
MHASCPNPIPRPAKKIRGKKKPLDSTPHHPCAVPLSQIQAAEKRERGGSIRGAHARALESSSRRGSPVEEGGPALRSGPAGMAAARSGGI